MAVLFAGAAQPRGPSNVTINTNDALEVAAAYREAAVVSVHNLGWSHYTQSQEDLAKAFDAVGQRERFHQLVQGGASDFEL